MTGMRIIVKVGLFAPGEVWCRAPAPPDDSIPDAEVCRVFGYRLRVGAGVRAARGWIRYPRARYAGCWGIE